MQEPEGGVLAILVYRAVLPRFMDYHLHNGVLWLPSTLHFIRGLFELSIQGLLFSFDNHTHPQSYEMMRFNFNH